MGRPREVSEEERAELIRKGYRPIEVWVPDLDNESVRSQLQEEARKIAKADEAEGVMDWLDAVGPANWDKP
ncbi:antitoxin MazE-like protein [Neorhizobium sp. DAR64860/K0K1]|uniref:antitoxin MazE-like protein n=1 Tax=Neorhizobium sp. DAR64860/K0K1 TaxID=3421955 RepID=UPI003D267766